MKAFVTEPHEQPLARRFESRLGLVAQFEVTPEAIRMLRQAGVRYTTRVGASGASAAAASQLDPTSPGPIPGAGEAAAVIWTGFEILNQAPVLFGNESFTQQGFNWYFGRDARRAYEQADQNYQRALRNQQNTRGTAASTGTTGNTPTSAGRAPTYVPIPAAQPQQPDTSWIDAMRAEQERFELEMQAGRDHFETNNTLWDIYSKARFDMDLPEVEGLTTEFIQVEALRGGDAIQPGQSVAQATEATYQQLLNHARSANANSSTAQMVIVEVPVPGYSTPALLQVSGNLEALNEGLAQGLFTQDDLAAANVDITKLENFEATPARQTARREEALENLRRETLYNRETYGTIGIVESGALRNVLPAELYQPLRGVASTDFDNQVAALNWLTENAPETLAELPQPVQNTAAALAEIYNLQPGGGVRTEIQDEPPFEFADPNDLPDPAPRSPSLPVPAEFDPNAPGTIDDRQLPDIDILEVDPGNTGSVVLPVEGPTIALTETPETFVQPTGTDADINVPVEVTHTGDGVAASDGPAASAGTLSNDEVHFWEQLEQGNEPVLVTPEGDIVQVIGRSASGELITQAGDIISASDERLPEGYNALAPSLLQQMQQTVSEGNPWAVTTPEGDTANIISEIPSGYILDNGSEIETNADGSLPQGYLPTTIDQVKELYSQLNSSNLSVAYEALNSLSEFLTAYESSLNLEEPRPASDRNNQSDENIERRTANSVSDATLDSTAFTERNLLNTTLGQLEPYLSLEEPTRYETDSAYQLSRQARGEIEFLQNLMLRGATPSSAPTRPRSVTAPQAVAGGVPSNNEPTEAAVDLATQRVIGDAASILNQLDEFGLADSTIGQLFTPPAQVEPQYPNNLEEFLGRPINNYPANLAETLPESSAITQGAEDLVNWAYSVQEQRHSEDYQQSNLQAEQTGNFFAQQVTSIYQRTLLNVENGTLQPEEAEIVFEALQVAYDDYLALAVVETAGSLGSSPSSMSRSSLATLVPRNLRVIMDAARGDNPDFFNNYQDYLLLVSAPPPSPSSATGPVASAGGANVPNPERQMSEEDWSWLREIHEELYLINDGNSTMAEGDALDQAFAQSESRRFADSFDTETARLRTVLESVNYPAETVTAVINEWQGALEQMRAGNYDVNSYSMPTYQSVLEEQSLLSDEYAAHLPVTSPSVTLEDIPASEQVIDAQAVEFIEGSEPEPVVYRPGVVYPELYEIHPNSAFQGEQHVLPQRPIDYGSNEQSVSRQEFILRLAIFQENLLNIDGAIDYNQYIEERAQQLDEMDNDQLYMEYIITTINTPGRRTKGLPSDVPWSINDEASVIPIEEFVDYHFTNRAPLNPYFVPEPETAGGFLQLFTVHSSDSSLSTEAILAELPQTPEAVQDMLSYLNFVWGGHVYNENEPGTPQEQINTNLERITQGYEALLEHYGLERPTYTPPATSELPYSPVAPPEINNSGPQFSPRTSGNGGTGPVAMAGGGTRIRAGNQTTPALEEPGNLTDNGQSTALIPYEEPVTGLVPTEGIQYGFGGISVGEDVPNSFVDTNGNRLFINPDFYQQMQILPSQTVTYPRRLPYVAVEDIDFSDVPMGNTILVDSYSERQPAGVTALAGNQTQSANPSSSDSLELNPADLSFSPVFTFPQAEGPSVFTSFTVNYLGQANESTGLFGTAVTPPLGTESTSPTTPNKPSAASTEILAKRDISRQGEISVNSDNITWQHNRRSSWTGYLEFRSPNDTLNPYEGYFIRGLWITEDIRRQGVGRALINQMLETARSENQPVNLVASPTLDSEIPLDDLVNYYRQFGFQVVNNGGEEKGVEMRWTP